MNRAKRHKRAKWTDVLGVFQHEYDELDSLPKTPTKLDDCMRWMQKRMILVMACSFIYFFVSNLWFHFLIIILKFVLPRLGRNKRYLYDYDL